MKKVLRILIGMGTLLAMVTSAVPVGADMAIGPVVPATVDETLLPGESIEVEKEVTTPEIPPLIDICLLEDETGSFSDDISNLKGGTTASDLFDTIVAASPDAQFAVAGFRDYPGGGYGNPDDWVYRLLSSMSAEKTDWLNGIASLTAGGGNDAPEAQYDAMVAAAGPGTFTDPTLGIQDNCGWRVGSQRVLVVAVDSPFHTTDGTHVNNEVSTTAALDAQAISVLGLKAPGAGDELDNLVDGLAQGGSVQALTSDGANIANAILDGLMALTTDVWWEVESDPGLSVSLSPIVLEDVSGGSMVSFTETITVDEMAAPGEYSATVIFYANSYPDEGEEIGRQSITITVPAVPFDVKPQSCRNPLIAKGGGVVPAAVVGTPDFDVTSIDVATLEILGVAPLRWNYEDVATPFSPFTGKSDPFDCTDEGGDGFTDLTLKFDKKELVEAIEAEFGPLEDGQVLVLEITGEQLDGRAVLGEDVIVILKKSR